MSRAYVDPGRRRRYGRPPSYSEIPASDDAPRLSVRLVRWDGVSLQVGDRISDDELSTITEAVEEDLLELTHGDADLALEDQDGLIERFLRGIDETDLVKVYIDRFRVYRRRIRERLFGGVLDLPWSLRYDRINQIVRVHAFSFSKMLERASAESVKRAFSPLTGSVALGNRRVTISASTTGMMPFDQITLNDGLEEKTQTIRQIVSSTQVDCVDVWDHTFAAGSTLTLDTPYYRDKSVEFLAEALFDAAGITSRSLRIDHPLATYPIDTPVSTDNFFRVPSTGRLDPPDHIMPRAASGGLRIATDSGMNHDAPDPRSQWAQNPAGWALAHDWTPYYDAEPANLPPFDANNGDAYDLEELGCSDHQNNRAYSIRTVGSPYSGLFFTRDGGTVDTLIVTGGTATTAVKTSMEYDPGTDHVWVSWTGKIANAWDNVSVFDSSGALVASVETARSGHLRYLRRLKLMALHEREPGATGAAGLTTNLHLYDAATHAFKQTIQVPVSLFLASMRVSDRWVACLYSVLNETRVRIWTHDFVQIADYQVAPELSGVSGTHALLTVFTEPETKAEEFIGYAGNALFVLATNYAGVIPYADFEGKGCAAGLKELAKVTMSFIDVDHSGAGALVGRDRVAVAAATSPIVVGEPSEHEHLPLWEFLRTSVEVRGTDTAGTDFKYIAGATGDSARRLEIESDFITSRSLACGIANLYVSLFSRRLGQEEITAGEPEQAVHPLRREVLFERVPHLVFESILDLRNRSLQLRLARKKR